MKVKRQALNISRQRRYIASLGLAAGRKALCEVTAYEPYVLGLCGIDVMCSQNFERLGEYRVLTSVP